MFKQYYKQAIAQLRQHPLISAISIVGTALSIFLIMLVVMMQQVKVAPFSPESNRDRFLHVSYISVGNKEWGEGNSSNGPMSVQTTRELYKPLTTAEAVTTYCCGTEAMPVSLPGIPSITADVRQTDAEYFHVFDFQFVEGKPYDEATFNAGQTVAVISERISISLFGAVESVGKEFLLNHAPYKVVGVVKDVSTLATKAYGQVWIPFTSTNLDEEQWTGDLMGVMSVTILAHNRSDFDNIRAEADRRLREYNKKLESGEGYSIITRNRPYDQEKDGIFVGANNEPDVSAEHRKQLIVFVILLLVPAINLSSMTQSRMRQRMAEIGVRRAFGSTRTGLMGQIVMESLITTLLAGVLGLLFCFLFSSLFSDLLFQESRLVLNASPAVNAEILMQPSTFLYALLFCFVLNLLSSCVPAWRASRISIVNALGGRIH